VRASGSQSRKFSVRSGIPQGSDLGPLLFILFINDVFLCFKSLRILLYVDDLKIFFPVAGNSEFANAQAERDVFCFFPVVHQLGRHFQYGLSGHRLDSSDSNCDLGVALDSKINFTSHIGSLVVKASRQSGAPQHHDLFFF
jgi:hypothetical protein